MIKRLIKGNEEIIYSSEAEFKKYEDEEIHENWRKAPKGAWIKTDNGKVVRILARNSMVRRDKVYDFIRTPYGQFICEDHVTIKGEPRTNIYTFSGNYDSINEVREQNVSSKKVLFAQYVAAGMDMSQAYSKVYPKAKDEKYIKSAASKLLQQKKVQEMVKEEIREILQAEGVSPEYIIQKYKDIADISERDSDRLRSLDALAKMSGLFDTEKKQEQLTVWSGFSPEQLEAIKNGQGDVKVLAHAEKDK